MNLKCNTWFERDRAVVTLEDEATGQVIFDLVDEDVAAAIADGYLPTPKINNRPTWLECAIEYAHSMGLLKERT